MASKKKPKGSKKIDKSKRKNKLNNKLNKLEKSKRSKDRRNKKVSHKTTSKKKKINREKIIILLLLLIIVSGISFYLFEYIGHFSSEEELDTLENERMEFVPEQYRDYLSLDNFTEIGIEIDGNVIVLSDKKDECNAIVLMIDPNQAYYIEQGIESKVGFRPSSHDMIGDILEEYDIEVVLVKITELKKGTYFGRIILDDGEKVINLDIRPSDGIAVAVRRDKPIYISEDLLDEFGENIC